MSSGKFLCEAVDVVEVAVRFVLVLLFQFVVIEAFVVEFRGQRDGWFGSWLERIFGF